MTNKANKTSKVKKFFKTLITLFVFAILLTLPVVKWIVIITLIVKAVDLAFGYALIYIWGNSRIQD